MSAPTRPRPRPRPKPRTAAISSDPANAASGSTSSYDSADAMFMKNTDLKSWRVLEKKAESAQKTASSPSKKHRYSDSEDESSSPSSSPRSRQKGQKKGGLPAWAKKNGKKALDFIHLISDEEEEETLKNNNKVNTVESPVCRTPVTKKKKTVQRSPSITPPPPVPLKQLQNARNVVRECFDSTRSSPPVIDVDNDDDEEPVVSFELAPELVAIAANTRRGNSVPMNNTSVDPSTSIEVTFTIKWLPHPKDEEGEVQSFQFKMRRDEAFVSLFQELADTQGVLEEKLVVTLNGKRVFPAATPQSLSIWSAAELEACTLHVYEYLQAQKRERALSPSIYEAQMDHGFSTSLSGIGNAANSVVGSNEFPQDTFKLSLRSGETRTITVTVRPSTLCSLIVASFLKKSGMPASASRKARISVDGESLNPDDPIEVAGLEDGDVVDIVGV